MSLASVFTFKLLKSKASALELLIVNHQVKKKLSVIEHITGLMLLSVKNHHLHFLDI